MAVEEIVTEDQGRWFVARKEADVGRDGKGLCESVRAGLFGLAELETMIGAIAEELLEIG